MINDFKQLQRHYRTMALLAAWPWLVVALIAIIGLLVMVLSPKPDPIDNQLTRRIEFVKLILVVDDRRNGFRVRYITKKSVTKERLSEILQRVSVRDSLNHLQRMAPLVFGDMLLTDIYEFADFAKRFDPADIEIYDIFVSGPDKEKLYIGENPRIENWAKRIDPNTLQGLLYLRREDIYCNSTGWSKVYRYWKCYGVHQISVTDEHFSHFSEDERIY